MFLIIVQRIEFQRVQRLRNDQRGCFMFRKYDNRYKFSKHQAVNDDSLQKPTKLKKQSYKVDEKDPIKHKEEIHKKNVNRAPKKIKGTLFKLYKW